MRAMGRGGRRAAVIAPVLLAAALALTPRPAAAWWRAGWGWGWHPGWGVRVVVPPVVVAPPVAYVPPPVAYAPPPVAYAPGYRWIPGHYGAYGYWVPGHWGY